jgi:hypothetical protein
MSLIGMKKYILSLVSFFAMMFFVLAVYVYSVAAKDTLPEGLSVLEWQAAGLTYQEFNTRLYSRIHVLKNQKITITPVSRPGQQSVLAPQTFTLERLGMTVDTSGLMKELRSLQQGSPWSKMLQRRRLANTDLKLQFNIEPEIIESELSRAWGEKLFKKPVNAERQITAYDQIRYIPEIIGYSPDFDFIRKDLIAKLPAWFSGAGSINPDPSSDLMSRVTLPLPFRAVQPEITVEHLKAQGIERKIIQFTTSFSASKEGRVHNIAAAAKTVDNMLLAPGEIFDYEKVIQETKKKIGFKEAPIIFNGKLVPGIGGGICQVSSTLYNAILRIGLEVVERRNHSLPVRYVPLGQDATFSSGAINFKFRNSTDSYLLIRTVTTANSLTVKLFGSAPRHITYEVQSKIVRTLQPQVKYVRNSTLPKGGQQLIKEGKVGYMVETYRIKKENGTVVEKELVSKDIYPSQPRIVAVNRVDTGAGQDGSDQEPPGLDIVSPKKNIIEDGVSGPLFQ